MVVIDNRPICISYQGALEDHLLVEKNNTTGKVVTGNFGLEGGLEKMIFAKSKVVLVQYTYQLCTV